MAAYVIVRDGLWVNTAEWDGVTEWPLSGGDSAIPFEDGVLDWDGNWTHAGVKYSPPNNTCQTVNRETPTAPS